MPIVIKVKLSVNRNQMQLTLRHCDGALKKIYFATLYHLAPNGKQDMEGILGCRLKTKNRELKCIGPVRDVLLQWRVAVREEHATVLEKKKS